MLVDATIDGDMEVVSKLISDGIDMNAIVHEVDICIATLICLCKYNNVHMKLYSCVMMMTQIH